MRLEKRLANLPLNSGDRLTVDDQNGIRSASMSEIRDIVVGSYVSFPFVRTAAAIITVGPTAGWLMPVPTINALYVEFPIHPKIDRTQDIIMGISWAPSGSQANKKVSWRVDVGAEKSGSTVTVVDSTIDCVDEICPATIGIYVRSTVSIPASLLTDVDVDEIHAKITRIASSADPVDPGIHHIVVVQKLL